ELSKGSVRAPPTVARAAGAGPGLRWTGAPHRRGGKSLPWRRDAGGATHGVALFGLLLWRSLASYLRRFGHHARRAARAFAGGTGAARRRDGTAALVALGRRRHALPPAQEDATPPRPCPGQRATHPARRASPRGARECAGRRSRSGLGALARTV